MADKEVELPNHLNDSSQRDEEGLLVTYDAIICGTGLVQSILASALSRAGKSVLHADTQDYYGELDAVWTLPYIMSKLESSLVDGEGLEPSSDHKVPLRPSGGVSGLRVHNISRNTEFEVELGSEVVTPYGSGTVLKSEDTTSTAIRLDNWKLACGNSPTVFVGDSDLSAQNVVSSKEHQAKILLEERSRGFSLDVFPGLLYASGSSVDGLLKSGVADYVEFKSIEGLLWMQDGKLEAVPCSKNDVFQSKLLSPMEKRRLMKFLQLALDYGTAKADEGEEENAESVESLNERHLNQGRSLARPQNKAVVVDELQDLEASMDLAFEEYLQTQKLSPKLRKIVRYALALESGGKEWTLKQGMDGLCSHIAALGRFGTTAFLAPLYGSGELPQAFCRSAAVYGATYLLRRTPRSFVLENDRAVGVVLGNDEVDDKTIQCDHVVVPRAAINDSTSTSTPQKWVWRRICIYRGRLLEKPAQRHVVIIPPSSDSSSSTTIYGVVLDEGVNVAPFTSFGSTVLHLTTTTFDNTNGEALLSDANEKLSAGSSADEIFSMTFSFPIFETTSQADLPNVHVIETSEPHISLDDAFSVASRIFERICPEDDFLVMSKRVDTIVKERLGDQGEDEEGQVLDSAMEMIGAEDSAKQA